MKIALLNPATTRRSPYPHLGLAFLAVALERGGHQVMCRDGSAPYADGTNDGLVDFCREFKPDLIGVTATTECVKFAYHLLYLLRNTLGNIPIIAGGPHATICPEEMVAHGFDVAVCGAAETRINSIVQALASNRHDEIIACGRLACRMPDRSIILNQSKTIDEVLDINELYPIRLIGFDSNDYSRIPSESYRFGALLAGRGCPGRCIYCDQSVFGRKCIRTSPDAIVADMVHRRVTYAVDHFYFLDDTLLWNKKDVMDLCHTIAGEPQLSGITWGCNGRADRIGTDVLQEIKKAGCTILTLGLESGDPETLKRIKKGIDLETMVETANNAVYTGLDVQVNLMCGFPWETCETVRHTRQLAERLMRIGVRTINMGYTVFPYPGTELYESFRGKGYPLDHWWLRDDFLEKNNSSRLTQKTLRPLFRTLVPEKPSIDTRQDFFLVYRDRRLTQEVTSLLGLLQRHRLNNTRSRFLKYPVVRLIIEIWGKALYALSPRLERAWWRAFRLI